MNLVRELKRRNVFRMAGLYLVGAWLLVQIASTLFPAFGVPGWALRGLVIVLALGFIPAVIFAWVFEFTPDGIKRDEEVAPGQSIAPQTAQRMNRLLVALLLLATVYFGFDKFVLAPKRDVALVANTAQAVKAETLSSTKATDNRASIAVLPFVKKDFPIGFAYQIAQIYAWRGEKDQAFAWLERCFPLHDAGLVRLPFDPAMDPLRKDPRFAALVTKMGFPK